MTLFTFRKNQHKFNLPELDRTRMQMYLLITEDNARMRRMINQIVGQDENLHFDLREFVAQGDKVVILGDYGWRIKATGKEYESDFVHVCTFDDDGKITSFKEYLDTAAARDAYTASTQAA